MTVTPRPEPPVRPVPENRSDGRVRTGTSGLLPTLKSPRVIRTPGERLRVGYLDTVADWRRLKPWWDALLARTPGGTVFSSYAYLRLWWQWLPANARLYLVVVLSGESVRAVAPLQIMERRWLGRPYRTLRLLGRAPDVDRPVALIPEGDTQSADAIADYLLHDRRWEHVILEEQQSDSLLLQALNRRLHGEGFLITRTEQPHCWCVDVNRDWHAYLADRSRAQRKSIRRHENRIRQAGPCRLETVDGPDGGTRALSRYLAVERRSWKCAAKQGVSAHAARLAFYRALARYFGQRGSLHFRFLNLKKRDVAATFGLLWRGCFHSLQIAHDESYATLSPGFVLTARELEAACRRPDYFWINYLGGSAVNNKRGWATLRIPTVMLQAHPPSFRGRTYHLCHVHLRPRALAMLGRARRLWPGQAADKETTPQ